LTYSALVNPDEVEKTEEVEAELEKVRVEGGLTEDSA
jgi:hypothetical protein